MKHMKLVSLCMMVGATAAQAQSDQSLYPVNTTVRDYAKRDRLLIGSLEYVSPSQLHENYGLRARLEAEMQNSELKKQGVKSDLDTPAVNAGVNYGWQNLTLGVEATYLSASNDGTNGNNISEDFEATRVTPAIAYTFGENVTAGVGVELNYLDVKEKLATTSDLSYDFPRAIVGIAYHNPKMEVGIAYTSEVQENDRLNGNGAEQNTLTLAATPALDERAIYLPAMGTVYARGNLTDSFSLMSSVSVARYDGNVDGAVPLFDEYKAADRVAARLLGTYWTPGRSRISLAAEYKGAATTAVGAEETGLGYRLANLYGGTLEGVLSINRKTYLGLNASYMRGERSDTLDSTGERFTGKEDTSRYAGFVTVKI